LREDAVGNIFARWQVPRQKLPAVATGSHIDANSQRGKYDGIVGVIGRELKPFWRPEKSGFRPKRSID